MSHRDLVTAYASGRLSRRSFVSGLTALGVSASAATAYATVLHPTRSAAAQSQACGELYPPQVEAPDIPIPPKAPAFVQDRLKDLQARLDKQFADLQDRLNKKFAELRNRHGC
jgi:hypothetical protein